MVESLTLWSWGGMPTRESDKGIAIRDSAVKGRHATGGGAVFGVD